MTEDGSGGYEGEWLTESNSGCRLWLWHAGLEKQVHWSGACVDGKAHGEGTMTLRYAIDGEQHQDIYEGAFENGKMHGCGSYTWSNGDKYEGDFVAGRKAGHGCYSSPDGSGYEGDWRDDTPHGRGTFIRSGGHHDEEADFEQGRTSRPLHPQPAWDLAGAGRIIAAGLIDAFKDEGGKLTPELMSRLHDRLLQLSLKLGSEALDVPKFDSGALDGSKVDSAKVQATWVLSGIMEEIENRRLPPRKR